MVGGWEVLGGLENMKYEIYEEYDCILCMVHLYLFFILCFLKWSDKRILCDLLVLMITTLWLCFSHDDDMIWHNMTCSSTMGHTGKQFGLVKEFEDSRSRYQGCYMICKI